MQIFWKRRDPFDSSDPASTAQVGRQGDDSVPQLVGKPQERGLGQRAVALAVSLVGPPHYLDQLEFASGQQRTDFAPLQNDDVAIIHGCSSDWFCQKCATSPKCSSTHSSE